MVITKQEITDVLKQYVDSNYTLDITYSEYETVTNPQALNMLIQSDISSFKYFSEVFDCDDFGTAFFAFSRQYVYQTIRDTYLKDVPYFSLNKEKFIQYRRPHFAVAKVSGIFYFGSSADPGVNHCLNGYITPEKEFMIMEPQNGGRWIHNIKDKIHSIRF